MPHANTVSEQRRSIEEAREEGYRQWEASIERDEITDAAERVRATHEITQEFFLSPDGLVNDLGQQVRPLIANGLEYARTLAASNPDWQVEVERRQIELEEYDAIEALAQEGEGSGAIFSFWLIPDSVRHGKSSLPGYNRERLKMYRRLAVPTENGVLIRHGSLDGSNYQATQAMFDWLGEELPLGLNSEEIARRRVRTRVPVDSITDTDNMLRGIYDGSLSEQFGGQWYGGRPPLATTDLVDFIGRQKDLLAEHMAIVKRIMAQTRDYNERNRLLENHRYNFAAALDARLHGTGGADLQSSGDAARAQNISYDGDCPVDLSLKEALERLGFKTYEKPTCPFCLQKVDVDPCASHIICPECHAEVENGKVKYEGNARAKKVGSLLLSWLELLKPKSERKP